MKALSTSIFLLLYLFSSAQGGFIIKGKIKLLSQSKKIIISGQYGQFEGDIKGDGSFFIQGNYPTPSIALIKTDSSGSDALWLEPGNYNVKFKEIKLDSGSWYYFRIPELKGPEDAEIYYGFSEPQFYIKGNSRDETKEKFKHFFSNYIDCVFRTNPSTAPLPEMLRFSRGVLSDGKIQEYMSLLDEDQKKSVSADLINDYFKRKEKIEKEKHFQSFQMKDQHEKIFKLASVNKKLILLDFWSSDCAPCRHKHPKLVELYRKYSDKGLEIISISLDDKKENWKKAILKDNMTWINVSELKGWETSLAKSYFIKSIPFSFWLDKNKKIISSELSEKEIEEYLK